MFFAKGIGMTHSPHLPFIPWKKSNSWDEKSNSILAAEHSDLNYTTLVWIVIYDKLLFWVGSTATSRIPCGTLKHNKMQVQSFVLTVYILC